MDGSALETTALGKRYGRTWAVRDCSFQLPEGSVAALVGPNGAGKTTLLHLAVGLLRPDAGEVSVFGRDPRTSTEALSQVGFVAQDAPLYRDFTATELFTMGAKLNRDWDAALARDRLAQLGIAADKKVGKLSGGQRAQVALALALAKRPRLLLLDEPIASLDPLARHEFMQALMGAVADTGTTVLLSSHLLSDLERVCDHLILQRAAQVRLTGPVDDLLAVHRTLVGPRRTGPGPIAGVAEVVRASHTDRQSTLLVRTHGPAAAVDPAWIVHEVSLEDLVLAHLAGPEDGSGSGPAVPPAGAHEPSTTTTEVSA